MTTETMQVITWVLGTLISLNTIAIAVQTIVAKKRSKRNTQIAKEIIEPVIKPINDSLETIKSDLANVTSRIDKNERDRLKDIIIATKRKFDDFGTISEEEFMYCSECFDKYTSLGGNSYIKTVMNHIKTKWEETVNKKNIK